jgi:hypothetical protein
MNSKVLGFVDCVLLKFNKKKEYYKKLPNNNILE